MKHMKLVEIPARTEKRLDKITCDLCNSIIKEEGYHFSDVSIELREGVNYPDCHDETITKIDCCKICWGTKIVPMIQSLGVTFYEEELVY